MKKSIVISLFSTILLISSSVAQEIPEKKFLFNTDKLQLSTFFFEVSPMTNITTLNKQAANIFSISAGFILNNKFSVSFFSSSSPKINLVAVPEFLSDEYFDWIEAGVELDLVSMDTEFLFVDFKHSGLKFSYLHNTDKIVFWRANLALGFIGGLSLAENKTFMGLFNNQVYEEKVVTVMPELGVGVNLLSWWRVYADIGYRLLNADTRIMSAADSDGLAFSLTFGFGNFSK